MSFDINHPEVIEVVQRALQEDVGCGDITTNSTVAADLQAEGFFTAKQKMIVAGVELLCLLFDDVTIVKRTGESANSGDTLATVRCDARTLLTRERVSLNFLQRLSGIATLARAYVDEIAGTTATVLDTRKTTPGLRRLEKMAAHAGGATNHRMGLFDAILIKNNHITLAGGVKNAIERAQSTGGDLPIEVEVRTRGEIVDALSLGVSRLLLDNMTPGQAATEIAFILGQRCFRGSQRLKNGVAN